MALRYWVGGTAAWDGTAGTKWSATSGGAGGQTVPTSADNVFFDAASGAGVITISAGNTGAASINCTGFTGTLAGTAALSVVGSITLVAGMTLSYSGEITLTGTGTLTTAGKTIGALTVAAVGGTVTLGSALTSSSIVTVTGGTFTTSATNYALTATQLVMSGTGVKAVTLNGSAVALSGSSVNAIDYSGSNLTFNAGTSTITFSAAANLNGGAGLVFNNVTFANTVTLTSPASIVGANTFAQLTLTAPATTGIISYDFSANQTITTFVCAGASAIRRLSLESDVPGTARTLTVGTYTTKTDVDFRDITAAGTSAPWSGTRLGNCLGNTSITFTAAKTVYWNLTGAQSWSSTGWATTSGGVPAATNFPLAHDVAVLNNAGAATSINIDSYWNIGTLTASARTSAVTLTLGISCNIYGNWTSGSGVSFNFTGDTTRFAGRSTQTITSAGGTFGFIRTSESPTATLSLADALIVADLTLSSGATFNANSYAVTAGTVSTSTGTINLGSASWTLTGTGTVWNASTLSTVSGAAEILLSDTSTTARTFSGGNKTYGKLTIGGATGVSTLTITGTNTFSEIASTKTVAHTIIFPNATTTVGSWGVEGSAGNLVTLSRTGASGTFTLAKSGGGDISTDFLSISNSAATPASTWYAGANSTDGGANTGWTFTPIPSPVGGSAIMLFN